MMEKIYILLPVHNRILITRKFIECLRVQTYANFHLVLIDDGSVDGTAGMVMKYIPDATVLRGNGKWWWAGSLQHGINYLVKKKIQPNDIVLMINDDTEFDSDFLSTGQKILKAQPGSLLQAVITCDRTNEILDAGMRYEDKVMQFKSAGNDDEINCLTTNGLFMRWCDLSTVGNFYPRLLPHYLSDYEFTIRAYRKGLKLIVVHKLMLRWNRETTGLRKFNENNFLMFMKYYFSKRSVANPVYWTIFIFLVSKPLFLPGNLLRVWKSAVKTIGHHAILALKAKFQSQGMKN